MVDTSACKPRSSKANKGKGYHNKNNAVAWQEHQLAYGQGMKGDMGQIKEEKAHTQAVLTSKKKWDAKNEDPRTHPHQKS